MTVGFPSRSDSQRVIQESGIASSNKVVNDKIVSVRKLAVFEQVQVEAHIEGDICQLADVGRQMRRELLIIVITPPVRNGFERRLGGKSRAGQIKRPSQDCCRQTRPNLERHREKQRVSRVAS